MADDLAQFGRQEAARLAAERRMAAQSALERAVGGCGIPARYRGRGFDDFEAACPGKRHALAVCRAYAGDFAAVRRRGSCLLLLGGPGTGKTHLACAILAQVIGAGHTGLFLTVSSALRVIRDAYSPRGQRSELEAFALLTQPDLLVFDELGVAAGNPATRRALLLDILNERYGALRPTVLLGNLTLAELGVYLGERLMERLLDAGGTTVPFNWPSYRPCHAGTGDEGPGAEPR
jgi:DNA replication protein DnaC